MIPKATFKLLLQYDGRGFHGWQLQPDLRTVQGVLEEALGRLYDAPVRLHGAGRTDTGVHARGQVAHFRAAARHTPTTIRRALNATLPEDVWVADVRRVAATFHARFDAVARTYRYFLGTRDLAQSPFHRPYCWAFSDPLDEVVLRETAADVVGEHPFGGFSRTGPGSQICRVRRAVWEEDPIGWRFEITADRFLRGMVRGLVGSLVAVARGALDRSRIGAALASPAGAAPPVMAPARGLFLWNVEYPLEAAV